MSCIDWIFSFKVITSSWNVNEKKKTLLNLCNKSKGLFYYYHSAHIGFDISREPWDCYGENQITLHYYFFVILCIRWKINEIRTHVPDQFFVFKLANQRQCAHKIVFSVLSDETRFTSYMSLNKFIVQFIRGLVNKNDRLVAHRRTTTKRKK